ncbi:ankyrin repeat protein [Colletotrichum tofieldiae]|nr:ankyrin repeat protein [Colletotrichum tofieldiae]
MLGLVLDHADKSRWNEPSPASNGLALIHLLQAPGAEWIIGELVQRGADPDVRVDRTPHYPALVYYTITKRIDYATALLKNGADPSHICLRGFDAALAATQIGSVSFLSELYVADKGSAKINWSRTCKSTLKLGNAQYTVSGVNALHLGAIFGHVDTMVFYIDHGLINDVDTRSDDDCTPLHFAVARGNASVVKYLCARGCDIDARTANGSSPLHLAARHRRSEVARYLVASGCSVSLDSAGMKPSFYALQSNDETLIEIFKSAESGSREHSSEGHEQEAISQRKRYRAFSAAFENAILANNMDRCQELVSNGCDLEVPLHSCGGCSPLIKAIKYGRMAIVKWLLDNGASLARVSCGAKPGVSAIHLIFAAPRLIEVLPQCLDTYLRAGGTVLGESQSLVITAAASNNTAGLKLLLEHLVQHKDHCANHLPGGPESFLTAAVNEIDDGGSSALHWASTKGNLEAVNLLLDFGADVNALTLKLRDTPLHCAVAFDEDPKFRVALRLMEKGASLECRNHKGTTPILEAAHLLLFCYMQHLVSTGRVLLRVLSKSSQSFCVLGKIPML